MVAERVDPARRLQAWREAGADRMDRVRFDRMQALQARADGHDGAAARQLQARLDALLASYADDLQRWPDVASRAASHTPGAVPAATGPLAALLGHLATSRAPLAPVEGLRSDAATAGNAGGDAAGASIAHAAPAVSGFAPLPELQESRRTWARLRNESQVRQSLEQLDEDAGPLNSGRLVHRALTLMQQCSPGYLEHFVAYVDALSSLESLHAVAMPGSQAPAAARPARTRTRKRRE